MWSFGQCHLLQPWGHLQRHLWRVAPRCHQHHRDKKLGLWPHEQTAVKYVLPSMAPWPCPRNLRTGSVKAGCCTESSPRHVGLCLCAQCQRQPPSSAHQQNASSEQEQRGFHFPAGFLRWVHWASQTPHRSTPFSQPEVTLIPFLCLLHMRESLPMEKRLLRPDPLIPAAALLHQQPDSGTHGKLPRSCRCLQGCVRGACGGAAPAPGALHQLVQVWILLLAVVLLLGPRFCFCSYSSPSQAGCGRLGRTRFPRRTQWGCLGGGRTGSSHAGRC